MLVQNRPRFIGSLLSEAPVALVILPSVRRRVWCETLSYDQLASGSLDRVLQRYRVGLLLAVRPWQLEEVGDVVRKFQGSGVAVGLWPMVADVHGRWANAASHGHFIAFGDQLLAKVPFADELVIDLEPPLDVLTRWKMGRPTWSPMQPSYAAVRAAFAAAVERWRLTMRVTTAVMPVVAFEFGSEWLQRLMGTPVSSLACDSHSLMAYTSLFEGWSRGLVNRRRAEVLLTACAKAARLRFGARAALSLGTVGPGVFGDEPSYRDPAELRRDVALASAAGIDELSLFDLGGMARRGPVEAWLESLWS